MSTTRSALVGQTVLLLAAACANVHPKPEPSAAKKRILILGGTSFIGPKIVGAALAKGYDVTVFNRGKREKTLPFEFKDVEHLYGNRDPDLPADDEMTKDKELVHPDAKPKGLEELVGKSWDAVVDTSGYYPRMVGASAELLAPHVGQYIYVSSISAYAENKVQGADEDAPLAKLADPKVEDMGKDFGNYGGLKVLCEQAVLKAYPGKAAIVRPGYIVGPGDPTDRFTYWPVKFSRGGEVLVPGSPDDPIEWIDARDLGEWIVTLIENKTTGTFNAIGPNSPARWGDVIDACVKASKTSAKPVWVPTEWLQANGSGGEDSFPIWAPPTGDSAGFHTWKNERAKKTGLKFRPVADTIQATLEWYPKEIERRTKVTKEILEKATAKGDPAPTLPDPTALKAGPSATAEADLLAKWKAEKK